MKNVLALAILLFVFTHSPGQKSGLVLDLKKDTEYIHHLNSKSMSVVDMNGQESKIISSFMAKISYLVKEVTESGFEMDVVYKNLRVRTQLPEGTLEVSSEKNNSKDVMSFFLSEMKNKVFQVKMTRHGEITEVRNIESLFQVAPPATLEISEVEFAQVKAALLQGYGKESFKSLISTVTSIYPIQKAEPEDQWVISNMSGAPGLEASISTTYTLSEKTKEHYFIVGKSTIEPPDTSTSGSSITGTRASEIKVDKKSGWVIKAKINQEIKQTPAIRKSSETQNNIPVTTFIQNETVFNN